MISDAELARRERIGLSRRRATATHFGCGHPKIPENSHIGGRRYPACRTCHIERTKARYEREPSVVKERVRAWRLRNPEKLRDQRERHTYGVTRHDLPGTCGICGVDEDLQIDHCHTSGRVRGRLCGTCNTALGLFRDSPDRLRAALDYLDASD